MKSATGPASIRGRVNVDASLFYFKLDETITTFTNEQGVVLFRNAGATRSKRSRGIGRLCVDPEPAFLCTRIENSPILLPGIIFLLQTSFRGENDYSGNDLTGVAPHTVVNQLDIRTRPGFYLNFTHQFVDDIPLNDANTVYQEAYHLYECQNRIGGAVQAPN